MAAPTTSPRCLLASLLAAQLQQRRTSYSVASETMSEEAKADVMESGTTDATGGLQDVPIAEAPAAAVSGVTPALAPKMLDHSTDKSMASKVRYS